MFKSISFIMVCCVLMIGASIATAYDQPITIVTEDWPPYNYGKDGVAKGFSTEIVRAIMKDIGRVYHIQLLPGERGQRLLDEGTHVMSFSLFKTSERENKYKWIGPIAEESIYFYKKRGTPIEIRTLKDAMKVEKVACRHKGLVFDTLMRKGFKNLNLTPNPDGIIKKLARGRVALSVGESALGVKYWLRKTGLQENILVPTPLKLLEFPLYIACSKDIPDSVIQQWQNALIRVKASGEYEKIYNKYMVE